MKLKFVSLSWPSESLKLLLMTMDSRQNLQIWFIVRVKAEEAELMGPPFILPAEALSPQATGEAPMSAPQAANLRQTPADGLDDLFGPAIPVPGSEFLAGTGLETLEAPATDYSAFGESDLLYLLLSR